ncbi:DUF2231 domain-containing protein [Paracoccus aestuariivivens]
MISLLGSFPIACFSLTLAADIAYWQTENLMWLNFSAWLLAVGLLFASLAAIWWLLGLLLGWWRARGWTVVLGALVLIVAFLNNLVHAGDGWTAVVPLGISLSLLTVLLMSALGFSAASNRGQI